MAANLSRDERELVGDINAIAAKADLDLQALLAKYKNAPGPRWYCLVRLRSTLVRGFIVDSYTMIDDMLGSEIAVYLFRGSNFRRMWKREKFRLFNFFVLERLSLRDKALFVRDILRMPRAIFARLEAINALRNEVAHMLFPENSRAHAKVKENWKSIPISREYKGSDVFKAEGFAKFVEDCDAVRSYFTHHGKVYRKFFVR